MNNLTAETIKNSGMSLTCARGTTLFVEVEIYDADGNAYNVPVDGKVIFSVKKNKSDNTPLIMEEMTSKTQGVAGSGFYLQLYGDDTDYPAGRYWYDIVVSEGNAWTLQAVPPSILLITETMCNVGALWS